MSETINGEVCLQAIALLSDRLLAARSATREVERWCRERGIGDGRVTAAHRRGAAPPSDPADLGGVLADDLKELVELAAVATVFRSVTLMSGPLSLVEADNWYAPSALPPDMQVTLETTDIPYGRVIQNLNPTRRTFFVDRCPPDAIERVIAAWTSDPDDRQNPRDHRAPSFAFEHRALMLSGEGRPLAVVHERYRWELIFRRGQVASGA